MPSTNTQFHALEDADYLDPKAAMECAHHDRAGGIVDDEWRSDVQFLDMRLVRDCDDTEDLPDFPPIPANFDIKPRWESFCRLYAFGHSAADAARHSGFRPDSARQVGWRLLQDPRIQGRVRELQQFVYEHRPHTQEDVVVRLEAVYREAMERGQYSAAIRALEGIAKLEGLTRPAAVTLPPKPPSSAHEADGADRNGS